MFDKKKEKQMLEIQNELISKHCDEVENIYRQMRGWRHDYKNHLIAIQSFLELGQIEQCKEYCIALNEDLEMVDTVLKTGNVMLDAILNSKLSLAQSKGISVNCTAKVPEVLIISDIDLCTLVGNLLDNAIEACIPKNRETSAEFDTPFIRIYIGMKGSQLYISILNTVYGRVKKIKGKFLSTKREAGHGFGMMRIDKICKKYGAYCHRGSEEGAFSTEIMVPNRE